MKITRVVREISWSDNVVITETLKIICNVMFQKNKAGNVGSNKIRIACFNFISFITSMCYVIVYPFFN